MCFKKASLMAIFFFFSCVPSRFVIENPDMVGKYYFDRKIKSFKKKDNLTLDEKRELIKLEVQYAYGVILEKSDRIIDENYQEAINLNPSGCLIFHPCIIVCCFFVRFYFLMCNTAFKLPYIFCT